MEEKKLGFLIANLFNDYTNYMNSYLKEMDLTLSQTRVLLVLALNNGVSIDYLAEKANIGKSSVTKSVKILEKKLQSFKKGNQLLFISIYLSILNALFH